MLLRSLVALLLLGAIPAQQSAIEALVSQDWRERNRAARELANAESLPVNELLAVLARDWDVPLVTIGLWGGRGGRVLPRDPAARVTYEAKQELASFWPPAPQNLRGEPITTDCLVVPWHPHDLVGWLLTGRKSAHDEVAKVMRAGPLRNAAATQLWLQKCEPDVEALLARDWKGSDLDVVVATLAQDEGRGRDLLAQALVRDKGVLRAAILRLGRKELFRSDAAIDAAVEAFLGDQEQAAAGWLLTRDGRATPAILARLGASVDADRALLGLLCIVEQDRREVVDKILPCLDSEDVVCQQRALVAVAGTPVAPATRAAAARTAMRILESHRTAGMRLLAIDALANLADGVDAEMRQRLAQMLEDGRPAGARARLLGCLWRLGAVPEVSTARKIEICTMYLPTADTWRAAAEDGSAAADALREMLVRPGQDTFVGACAHRLAQVAPESVIAWLDDERADVRRIAIHALQTVPANAVSTERVAALCAHHDDRVAGGAFSWLTGREDAGAHLGIAMQTIVRLTDERLSRRDLDFLRGSSAGTARLLAGLGPMFARGVGLELLDAGDPVVRAACREWLAATADPAVQARLRAGLVRGGFDDEDDVAQACEILRGPDAREMVKALADAPDLPDPLRGELERLIDAGLAAGRDDTGPQFDAQEARSTLLAHARR